METIAEATKYTIHGYLTGCRFASGDPNGESFLIGARSAWIRAGPIAYRPSTT